MDKEGANGHGIVEREFEYFGVHRTRETVVGRARKSRTSGAITMVGSWVVALAGTCGHVTEAKALGM